MATMEGQPEPVPLHDVLDPTSGHKTTFLRVDDACLSFLVADAYEDP